MKRGRVGLLVVMVVAVGSAAMAQERGGVAERSGGGGSRGGRSGALRIFHEPLNLRGPGAPQAGEIPRFSPFSSGILEQNFAIMRATSPHPNQYMGGQLNPIPRRFPGRSFYGDFSDGYYGGIGYGYYGGYGYPGFGFGISLGNGYLYSGVDPDVYGPVRRVPIVIPPYSPYRGVLPFGSGRTIVIQREIVIPGEAPAPRSEPRASDSEYYLTPSDERAGESLAEAVADIRKAWLNGDFERFKSRIRGEGKVRIYPRGKYQYSVSAGDFTQMTRDAMSRIDTSSFELDQTRKLDEKRAFVAGKHIYRDANGEKREVYVSYVLEREEGRWKIVEAGSSAQSLSRHEE